MTLHRPSKFDARELFAAVVDALSAVSERLRVVFPARPRTRGRLEEFGLLARLTGSGRVRLVEPVGHLDSVGLAESASCVLTGSGGLQEETTFLRVPCLTLRPSTERPITISERSNRLTPLARLDADPDDAIRIRESYRSLLRPALSDCRTSERIAYALAQAESDTRLARQPLALEQRRVAS